MSDYAALIRPTGLGFLLAAIGRRANLTDDEAAVFEQMREKTPARPVSFVSVLSTGFDASFGARSPPSIQ